jgi:hypothetical protein
MSNRAKAFFCPPPAQLQCPKEEEEHLPADWDQKPKICHGVHSFLPKLKKAAPTFFAGTETAVEVISAGAACATTAPGLIDALGQFAGPVSIGATAAGALVNVLKLIDGVCMEGWGFLGQCTSRISMSIVVIATVALALTFTGVGIPVALAASGINALVTSLGTELCEHGLMGTLHKFKETAEDALKKIAEMSREVRNVMSSPVKLKEAANQAGFYFFKMFMELLKGIKDGATSAFKALVGTSEAEDQQRASHAANDAECCLIRSLEVSFEELPAAEKEVDEDITGDMLKESPEEAMAEMAQKQFQKQFQMPAAPNVPKAAPALCR